MVDLDNYSANEINTADDITDRTKYLDKEDAITFATLYMRSVNNSRCCSCDDFIDGKAVFELIRAVDDRFKDACYVGKK